MGIFWRMRTAGYIGGLLESCDWFLINSNVEGWPGFQSSCCPTLVFTSSHGLAAGQARFSNSSSMGTNHDSDFQMRLFRDSKLIQPMFGNLLIGGWMP